LQKYLFHAEKQYFLMQKSHIKIAEMQSTDWIYS
jgi:hypothetical protein